MSQLLSHLLDPVKDSPDDWGYEVCELWLQLFTQLKGLGCFFQFGFYLATDYR